MTYVATQLQRTTFPSSVAYMPRTKRFTSAEKHEISKRIAALTEKCELNQSQIAKTLDITRSTVNAWYRGASAPDHHNADDLANLLGTTREYILYGTNDAPSTLRESTAEYVRGVVAPWGSDTPLDDDEVEIQLFEGVAVSGGMGSFEADEYSNRKVRMSASSLRKRGVEPENAKMVRVTGDSMYPMYPDGSYVIIDLGETRIRDGKRYVCEYEGMLIVKILQQKPGYVRVISANPDKTLFPDEEVTEDEDFRVIGKVFHRSGWDD